MDKCKLCLKESILQESHILPNSIAKRIKNNGQTIVITNNRHPKAENSNFNYVEPMFCWDCEQILCKYENYGTNVTINKNLVKRKGDNFVVFKVDFKRYFLYLISILWRAGLTNHREFSTVRLGLPFLELMRNCLLENKLTWQKIHLEDLISISIMKIKNEYPHLTDDSIRKIIITPRLDEDNSQTRYYYMMYDSFIFAYYYTEYSPLIKNRTKPKFRLRRSTRNKFPAKGIKSIPVINNKLYDAQLAAQLKKT